MTPTTFTAWSAAVFGRYLPAMQAEVEKWLEPHSTYFIAALREVVLRDHPSVYGKPPGVAELEKMKIEAYQRGHTLQAIEAAGRGTTLIADSVEEEVTPEAAEQLIADMKRTFERRT